MQNQYLIYNLIQDMSYMTMWLWYAVSHLGIIEIIYIAYN